MFDQIRRSLFLLRRERFRVVTSKILFALFFLTINGASFGQQVIVAGTDFNATLGKEKEYYIASDNIDQYGAVAGSLIPLVPWQSGLLENFSTKLQYLVIDNPVKIDSSVFKDLGKDYMLVTSGPTSGNASLFTYAATDMVPNTPVTVTVKVCNIVDPLKTIQTNPTFNCVGQPAGVKIRSQDNRIDRDVQLDASKQGTCTDVDITGGIVDATGQVKLEFTSLQTGKCAAVGISKIEIKGSLAVTAVSVQGSEVCAGEQVILSPKIPYNGDYVWEANDGTGWQKIGTTQSVAYETKTIKSYSFRFSLKPLGSTTSVTSPEIKVNAIKCCEGPGGSASSRVTIYYDDFGTTDLAADPTGKTYKVWDYSSDPTNPDKMDPKQVTKTTPFPFRWQLDQPPVGAIFNDGLESTPKTRCENKPPCTVPHDGEYVVASYITNFQPYQGKVGSDMKWAGFVTGPASAPPIAYDHSGKVEGGALFLNNPYNSQGSVVYKKDITNLCTSNGKTIFFECYITVFTTSQNGVKIDVRLTGGATPKIIQGEACHAGGTCANKGQWVRIAGEVELTGNTLTMEIINNAPNEWNQAGNDLIVDDIRILACAPPPIDVVFDAATLSKAEKICNAMDVIALPTDNLKKYFGGNPNYLFQWTTTPLDYKSWKNLGGPQTTTTKDIATPKTLPTPELKNGDKVYFRVVVAADAASLSGAGEFNINNPCRKYSVSLPIEATVECPKCVKPVVPAENTISTSTPIICSGNIPVITGSAVDQATYLWEQAENATGPWTKVTGGTTQNLPSVTLTNTNTGLNKSYFFRRTAQREECPHTTDPIEIKVSGGMTSGTIAANQVICKGGTPVAFTSTAPATGGTNSSIEYQWESSPNGVSNWTKVGTQAVANLTFTATTAPTDSVFYRRRAIAGPGKCDSAVTAPVKIVVVDSAQAEITAPVSVLGPDSKAFTFSEGELPVTAKSPLAGYSGTWAVGPKGSLTPPLTSTTNSVKGMNFEEQSTLSWIVQDKNKVCPPETASIVITRRNYTTANVKDDSLCVTGLPYALQGNGLITGESAVWEFVSASPAITPTWAVDPTDNKKVNITAVPFTGTEGKVELTFKYTVTSPLAPGGKSEDVVKIVVYDKAETATTSAPINTCSSLVQLPGNKPNQPTALGTWKIVNGQGKLENANVHNTTLSELNVIGTTNLTWTIDNHLCKGTPAPLEVNQKGKSTDAIFTITGGAYTSATDITNKSDIKLCKDIPYTLTAILPATGLKTGETAEWQNTGLSTVTGQNATVTFTSTSEGAAAAKWIITPSIAGCSPSVATADFKIGGKPVLDPITGPSPVCEDLKGTYTANLSAAAGVNTLSVSTYEWKSVVNVPSTTGKAELKTDATQKSADFTFTSTATTGAIDQATISVIAKNECGTSDPATVKVIDITLRPRDFTGVITGIDKICETVLVPQKFEIPVQTNIKSVQWSYVGKDTLVAVPPQPEYFRNITPSQLYANGEVRPAVDPNRIATLKATLRNECGLGAFKTKEVEIIKARPVEVELVGKKEICLPKDAAIYTATTDNGGPNSTFQFDILRRGSVQKTQAFSLTNTLNTSVGDLQHGDVIRVTVKADPNGGCFTGDGTADTSLTIDGYELPEPGFSRDSACSDDPITLCPDTVKKGDFEFVWRMDTTIVSRSQCDYKLTTSGQSGIYTLEINNRICGKVTSPTKVMRIFDKPQVVFDPSEHVMEVAITPSMQLRPTSLGILGDTLNKVIWTPTDLLNFSKPLDIGPLFTPPFKGGEFTYTLYVSTGQGTIPCASEGTVKIKVLTPVKVPNAFSPNGDGLNDKWVIDGLETYPNGKVYLFNRWGSKIFSVTPYTKENEFDGTNNGAPLPVGTYYYVIDLGYDTKYQNRHIPGSLTIVR